MRLQDIAGSTICNLAHHPHFPNKRQMNYAFSEGFKARARFQTMTEEEQEINLLQALRKLIKETRETVPYYRALLANYSPDFPTSWAEYRTLPVLDKTTVREAKTQLISQQYSAGQLVRDASGGSTGEPVVIYLSQADLGWKISGHAFYQALLGCPHGKRVATLYGGELEVNTKPSLKHKLINWLRNYQPHGCFRMDDAYLINVHQDFNQFQPDMIVAYATAIYEFALLLKSRGIQPNYPRKVILTGGEKLVESQRQLVESVFAVPVVERYGSREMGLMAYQLPNQGSHFIVDRSYCLIEPENEPDEQGYAPIVVTTLQRHAMPLLRYRIGDIGKFPKDWSKDQTTRRIEEIVGRTGDYIHLPGGKKIHSIEFPHLFKDYDIKLYQVVQNVDGSVVIRIVPGPQHTLERRNKIEDIIRQNLVGVSTHIEYQDTLERTTKHSKLRPVISLYQPHS